MRRDLERPDGVAGGIVRGETEPTALVVEFTIAPEFVRCSRCTTDVVCNYLSQCAYAERIETAGLLDPRDPDHSRHGIFVHHNCWKCREGERPCAEGNPSRCSFPIARND